MGKVPFIGCLRIGAKEARPPSRVRTRDPVIHVQKHWKRFSGAYWLCSCAPRGPTSAFTCSESQPLPRTGSLCRGGAPRRPHTAACGTRPCRSATARRWKTLMPGAIWLEPTVTMATPSIPMRVSGQTSSCFKAFLDGSTQHVLIFKSKCAYLLNKTLKWPYLVKFLTVHWLFPPASGLIGQAGVPKLFRPGPPK